MQAPDAGLDAVALTLANLYRVYSDPSVPARVRAVIHKSLERRWAAIDQEVAIMSVYLNAYVRGGAFKRTNLAVRPNSLYQMACRLVTRFYGVEGDLLFRAAFFDYDGGKKEFSPKHMGLAELRQLVLQEVFDVRVSRSDLSLMDGPEPAWFDAEGLGPARHRRVIRAQSARQARAVARRNRREFSGSERGFSRFGLYLTKLRSQMAVEKVRKIYTVDLELKRQHLDLGLATERIKRRYNRFAEEHEAESRALQDTNTSHLDTFDDLAAQLMQASDDADSDETVAPDDDGSDSEDDAPGPAADGDEEDEPTYSTEDLKLVNIFDLSLTEGTSTVDGHLGFYWKGGLKSLEEELQIYDLLMEDVE